LVNVVILADIEVFIVKYVTLYTDIEGNSHFKIIDVEFEFVNFAPLAPLIGLSSIMAASQIIFFKILSGWFGDWHLAPKRQFFCCLFGEFELTSSDGQIRTFRSGDVILLEYITGKGHQTRVMGKEEFIASTVQREN
jgi:hypothetical protein